VTSQQTIDKFNFSLRVKLSVNFGLKSSLRPTHQHEIESGLKLTLRPYITLRLSA